MKTKLNYFSETKVYSIMITISLSIFLYGCKKETLNNSIITGIVNDPNAPRVNATVKLYSKSINKSTSSDSTGAYKFTDLPRGDYQVVAGFQDYVYTDISGYLIYASGSSTVNAQVNDDNETIHADLLTNVDTLRFPPGSSGGGGGNGGGSCPYVYSFDGNKFTFNGDIYAGAIYPCLERNDYTVLNGLKELNGEYKIKISNELPERQYTNLAELMIVRHQGTAQILIDKYGKVQSLSNKQSPLSAFSNNDINYTKLINTMDGNAYLFDDLEQKKLTWLDQLTEVIQPPSALNSLVLTFDKPRNSEEGKLLIKAKNSNWFIFLYHEFTGFFGNYFNEWSKGQNKRSVDDLSNERKEEGIPLLVYVDNGNGWEYYDCFDLMGSVKAREMVLPMDMSRIKGRQVKIKLECAFMFWELDYVAMDFSKNIPFTIETVNPSQIISKNKVDKTQLLQFDDDKYLEHLKQGDEDILSYRIKKTNQGKSETYFLHSKGYYEQAIESSEWPQFFTILEFWRTGSFGRYSKERYLELQGRDKVAYQSRP